jgi:hypothetical protein
MNENLYNGILVGLTGMEKDAAGWWKPVRSGLSKMWQSGARGWGEGAAAMKGRAEKLRGIYKERTPSMEELSMINKEFGPGRLRSAGRGVLESFETISPQARRRIAGLGAAGTGALGLGTGYMLG